MEQDIVAYLGGICKELHELNDKLDTLAFTIKDKLGGDDMDNLNVTLFTDKPIQVTNKGEK